MQIVPPEGWIPRKDKYKNLEFGIPYPIEQIVTGNSGVYEVFLIQRESRSLTKYKKLVESFDYLTDNKSPLEIEKLVYMFNLVLENFKIVRTALRSRFSWVHFRSWC
jgi:hypothetical protein